MLLLYNTIYDNIIHRINDLEEEISRQEHLCKPEAKLLFDELTSVREKIIAYETQMETNIIDFTLRDRLSKFRQVYLRVLNLRLKLTKILSSTEPTSPTETNVNYQSKMAEQFDTQKNLDSQIHKQNFLIRQIESLEIPEGISAVRVQVINNHLSKLYDSFISNQAQIEANVEDDANTLETQQKISKQVQQKVIDLQTKLKEIEESMSISDDSSESTETYIKAELDQRIKTGQSSIKRIRSLEPKEDVRAKKAKVMYTHLDSIYKSFNANQTEIEKMVSGATLDDQLESSAQIQEKVIELKAMLKKIFAPIIPSSSTKPEAIASQEIFEDIRNNVILLQTTLQKFLDSEHRENKSFDKLSDIVTLMFQLLEKKYGIDIP